MPEFKPKYPVVWKAILKALRESGGSSSTKIAVECYEEIENFISATKKCECKCHDEDLIKAAESM